MSAASVNSRARTHRGAVGMVRATVLVGGLVATALVSPATANATCASFFGIGNSAQCTSSLTSIAIALGPGATAKATGLFTVAIANGLGNSATQTTVTTAGGRFNLAYAGGPDSAAQTRSNFTIGVAQGKMATVAVGNINDKDFFNIALNLGSRGLVTPTATGTYSVLVAGNGNLAVDLFGGRGDTGGFMQVAGNLNSAFSVGSRGSAVSVGTFNIPGGPVVPANLSTGFNLFGTNNIVTALKGPLSIAGSVGQTGKTIKQTGPGINVNNTVVLSAAATGASKRAPSAASSSKRPAAAAGSGHKASASASAGGSKRN
jgi:hypothetical protein